MNIYVGNLSFDTTEEDLRRSFTAFGEVTSVNVIKDKFSGKSRGFAFVEMASDETGKAAIQGLHETELQTRKLTVSLAKPRTEGGGGGGGGGRRPSYGGGGYGGGGGNGGGGGRY
jgi:RNA recognition motif-containing protein